MFNERGMTSRQPFGSRLSVVLEEGSADAASSGSGPMGRFGKAFVAVRSLVGQTSWHSKDFLPPHLAAAAVPCACLGKAPRSCGRRGTCWHRGGLAPCLAQPGAHSHTLLLHGTLPEEAATSTEWGGTCQPLPCHGLWSRDRKPGLSWRQPGMVGVRGYKPLHPALMK